ncbi:unnamed protein product [Urochloa decumbens]|uniref:F-box domain-containing protein n=1 Tax=Urochloa decumbens TaxID=240449 RepID=A0ABC8X588_9POAL
MFEPDSIKETCTACIRNEADSSYMDSRYLTSYVRNVLFGLQNSIYKFHFSDSSGVAKALAATFGWAFTTSFGRDTYHSLQLHDVQGLPGFIWGKLEEGKAAQLWKMSYNADSKLKIEIEYGAAMDLWPIPSEKSKEDIFIFFKLYNPQKEELRFAGGFFIKASQKLADVLSVFHSNLQFCKYSCRINSSSKSHGFAPMYACSKSWIMTSWNLSTHRKNLCCLRNDERLQQLLMVSWNPATRRKNLCCLRNDEGLQQPLMEVAARDFADLPQELLMNIFSLLETPDLVRVGSVCSSWNWSYAGICRFGLYKWPQTPCLIYTSESANDNVAFLYSLAEKRAYKLTLPEPPIHRRYLIGSSLGWLITADERSEMHLVNPVTSEQISLPSVTTIEQVTPIFDETGVVCKYRLSRHTARSVTALSSTYALRNLRECLFHKAFLFYDASARSYIVVLIHNPVGQLSFARLGDEKWTWLPPHTDVDDCIYKDGLLYAVTLPGQIIAFDLNGTVVTTKIIMGKRDKYGLERVYIVQAPWGDLLLVRRPEVWIEEAPAEHGHVCTGQGIFEMGAFENRTWKIAIYKVCSASRKLVQINSLHDHVLFLGHNQSLCLNAEEYPQLKPNHVYLTDDSRSAAMKCKLQCRLVIGILDLETKIMDEIVSPRPWSNCMAPLLIIPNPGKIDLAFHQQLNTTSPGVEPRGVAAGLHDHPL